MRVMAADTINGTDRRGQVSVRRQRRAGWGSRVGAVRLQSAVAKTMRHGLGALHRCSRRSRAEGEEFKVLTGFQQAGGGAWRGNWWEKCQYLYPGMGGAEGAVSAASASSRSAWRLLQAGAGWGAGSGCCTSRCRSALWGCPSLCGSACCSLAGSRTAPARPLPALP